MPKNLSTSLCHYCGDTFKNRRLLANHIRTHTDQENNNVGDCKRNKFKCSCCTRIFPNKGLLNSHNTKKHRKNSIRYKTKKGNLDLKHRCDGCHAKFKYNCQLKYHIRKNHFNLLPVTPDRSCKKVNEVWYEKVLNTDIVVKIKKMSKNNLLIRRIDEVTSEAVPEMDQNVINLRSMYPTNSKMQMTQCNVCSKQCLRKELRKHFAKMHRHLMRKKCEQCDCTFKKPTYRIFHVCPMK